MSSTTYTTSRLKAADVAATMAMPFVIEVGGKAVHRQRGTGEPEFCTYNTREDAEAELGQVWDTFPAAGVHMSGDDDGD